MIKKQFTLYLGDRPGMLAKVASVVAKAGINIEGISVAETSDMSLVQLVTSNASKAESALRSAAFSYTVQEVAVFSLDNKPGALAALADRFSRHGVNINYLYATTGTGASGAASVVIAADDVKKLEKIWAAEHRRSKA